MLLASVQNHYEYVSAVRGPADVGQIAVFSEVGDLHFHGRFVGCVEYAEGDSFGVHSVHRVFYGLEGAGARRYVQKRESRDETFVVAVVGESGLVRRPEGPGIDAEFVSGYYLTVGDFRTFGFGDYMSVAFAVKIVQAPAFGEFAWFFALPGKVDTFFLQLQQQIADSVRGY